MQGKVYWSDMLHELHETDPKSFVPDLESAIKFYREDYLQVVRDNIENCINTGEPFDFEAIMVTAKKKERWIRAIGTAEFEGGICKRIYGSFQNIHQHKETEIRLQTLADNLPGVVFQYLMYPDGTDELKSVTKGSQEVWGFSQEAVTENTNLLWNQIIEGGEYDSVKESILHSIQHRTKWTARWKYVMVAAIVVL